jgi:hypothetical protein
MNIARCAAIVLVGWTTGACSGRGEVTVYGPGPDDDLRDTDDGAEEDASVTVGASTGTGGGNLQQRCENWCIASRSCPESLFGGDECSGSCQQLGSLASATGCEAEYESLIDCVDTLQDVCDFQSSCAGSMSAVSSCFSNGSQ